MSGMPGLPRNVDNEIEAALADGRPFGRLLEIKTEDPTAYISAGMTVRALARVEEIAGEALAVANEVFGREVSRG